MHDLSIDDLVTGNVQFETRKPKKTGREVTQEPDFHEIRALATDGRLDHPLWFPEMFSK
jgi:hypothetical protein